MRKMIKRGQRMWKKMKARERKEFLVRASRNLLIVMSIILLASLIPFKVLLTIFVILFLVAAGIIMGAYLITAGENEEKK